MTDYRSKEKKAIYCPCQYSATDTKTKYRRVHTQTHTHTHVIKNIYVNHSDY